MYLRASEEYKKHKEAKKLLEAETEKRRQEFFALVPGGEEAYNNGVVVRGPIEQGEALEAAKAAFQRAEATEAAHDANKPDPVRNYRLVSVDGSTEFGRFRCEYTQAKAQAAQMIRELHVGDQPLEEELFDGTWVDYYPPRGEAQS